ncbi:hypothetical protein ACJ3XI_00590 [Litorimonas sp. RW-G-Af-16]|uniref:hypothetical protein n=1 Tax=Litorimonas sp. RW-G-Af-16 TaxID=3241168 RepID=UPI00390CA5ED
MILIYSETTSLEHSISETLEADGHAVKFMGGDFLLLVKHIFHTLPSLAVLDMRADKDGSLQQQADILHMLGVDTILIGVPGTHQTQAREANGIMTVITTPKESDLPQVVSVEAWRLKTKAALSRTPAQQAARGAFA